MVATRRSSIADIETRVQALGSVGQLRDPSRHTGEGEPQYAGYDGAPAEASEGSRLVLPGTFGGHAHLGERLPRPRAVLERRYRLRLPGLLPPELDVVLDTSNQHTLIWQQEVRPDPRASSAEEVRLDGTGAEAPRATSPEEVLPAGACNLYLFPMMIVHHEGHAAGRPYPPSAAQIDLLKRLITVLAVDPRCDFADSPDEVGAFPMHAIVVCNTEEALELSESLFTARPELLLPVHTTHRSAAGAVRAAALDLFGGESSLHILAVNRREELLVRMVALAVATLPRAALRERDRADESSWHRAERSERTRPQPKSVEELLRSQATGVFFEAMPMLFYGSTILSYAPTISYPSTCMCATCASRVPSPCAQLHVRLRPARCGDGSTRDRSRRLRQPY